ncbi:MAG: ferritin-like domain-containing protein [Acidimicrobiia bacterium]|nr:ferritin-like domain-containing protein [Acidimicrobiia bacterium]
MTVTDGHSSDSDILGRSGVNDVDAIIDICAANTDVDAVEHVVADTADAIFTWNYEKGERPKLEKLYEKAKTSQWNVETDLDWSTEVDPYEAFSIMTELGPETGWTTDPDSPIYGWGDKEMREFSYESFSWRLSQFLHGEQGALLCTAKIVETVPFYDAKLYASTQVMDEARHVEVFAKYLDEKVENTYPINPHLRLLLDDIINDSRWDMTYLGMQIMVEGLALAAFGFMHGLTEEPLLKKLLRYVMSDEARHVAFGVLSLQEVYSELSAAELRERQEFAFEAAVRMRDRFLQQEVWERMGVPIKPMVDRILDLPEEQKIFQAMLFSKIVPNIKKLGLLDAGDGWLRERFTEIGVIQFEDWTDTAEEYGDFSLEHEDVPKAG